MNAWIRTGSTHFSILQQPSMGKEGHERHEFERLLHFGSRERREATSHRLAKNKTPWGRAMKSSERALTRMEQLGPVTVREIIASGGWPANYRALAEEWLRTKDKEFRDARRNELQIAVERTPPASARQTDGAESSSPTTATLARIKQLGAQTVPETVSFGRWPANYRALARGSLPKAKKPEERARDEGQTRLERRFPTAAKQTRISEGRVTAATAASAKRAPRKIRLSFALWLASLVALFFVVIAAVWDFTAGHSAIPIPVETSAAATKGAPVTAGR